MCDIGTDDHGVLFRSEPFPACITENMIDATQFEIYLETL